GIYVAPQPLPGADQSWHVIVISTVDADTIVSCGQAPLGFVFDPAVFGFAFALAFPADGIAGGVQTFNIGTVVQQAKAVFPAGAGWWQMHIKKRSLPVFIYTQTGFNPDGLTEHNVLAIQAFNTYTIVTIHAQR